LSELSQLLSDPALRSAIARINDAAENLESGSRTIAHVLDERRISELAETLQKNLTDINTLTNQILKDSKDARIGESSTAFRDAAVSVVDSQQQLANTLDKLDRTLDSIRALSDSLEDDPSSLLRGKQRKPIHFKE
jgi:methyl-accepting chemotaxis protein